MDALEELAQLLLEKEVVERSALQSILKAKMTKDARELMQPAQSPSDGGTIEKSAERKRKHGSCLKK
jgi:hypothetical protein